MSREDWYMESDTSVLREEADAAESELVVHPAQFPQSKYLNFELDDHYEGKTERVVIVSKKRVMILGEIKWYGKWRQYAFFPEPTTVWNPECMADVQACIDVLKQRRESS